MHTIDFSALFGNFADDTVSWSWEVEQASYDYYFS